MMTFYRKRQREGLFKYVYCQLNGEFKFSHSNIFKDSSEDNDSKNKDKKKDISKRQEKKVVF